MRSLPASSARPGTPAVICIRTPEDAAAGRRVLPGSARRDWRGVGGWAGEFAGRAVAVVGRRGLKVSQGAPAWPRHASVAVEVAR